jgi:hypothetical protein
MLKEHQHLENSLILRNMGIVSICASRLGRTSLRLELRAVLVPALKPAADTYDTEASGS